MSLRARTIWALLAVFCSGCAILPHKQPPPITYDLGAAPALPGDALGPAIALQGVSGPVWLDSNAIEYRLSYQDEFRRQSYRDSRFVAPPLVLIRQRFAERVGQRVAVDGTRLPLSLRIELDEFVQLFDSPVSSRIKVQLRAIVQDPRSPNSTRERVFIIERTTSTPDSSGAIRAFAAAVDDIIGQTLAWATAP